MLLELPVCPHGTGSPVCVVGPILGWSPVTSLDSQTFMAGGWAGVSKGAQGSLLTHLPGVRVPSGRGGPLACSLNQSESGRHGAAGVVATLTRAGGLIPWPSHTALCLHGLLRLSLAAWPSGFSAAPYTLWLLLLTMCRLPNGSPLPLCPCLGVSGTARPTLPGCPGRCLYLLGPSQGCLLQLVVTVLGICAYRHPWKRRDAGRLGMDVWAQGLQASQ